MTLGAFSVSLSVKDLSKSRAFYTALGFQEFTGDADAGWIMLRNGNAVIGLFQGMFEGNLMTFNPGWDQNAQAVEGFTDIREIQATLKDQGIALETETDPDGDGPANFMVIDPDGNPVFLDQHVPKP
ncbi:MAG: VOC family protein [Pseudomonadota bacterium]